MYRVIVVAWFLWPVLLLHSSNALAAKDTEKAQILVSIVTHNEEPSEDPNYPSPPDYVNDPVKFWSHRAALVEFANALHDRGVMWNYQSDWCFLKAIGLHDTGDPSTNNKNFLRYIKEDLGFEVDPHAHQTKYNYADVAFLIEDVCVPVSGTVGGMVVDPPEASILEQFFQPITGVMYPDYTWEPNILWGGGTKDHVNEESLWASGVWRPKDKYHFLEHDEDPNKPPNVGRWGGSWRGLDELLQMNIDGKLSPEKIYTCTVGIGQGSIADPCGMAHYLSSLDERLDDPNIRWVGLSEVIDIWHSEYDSQPNILRYLQEDPNNLLLNSDFEYGSGGKPSAWEPFALGPPGSNFIWDHTQSNTGIHSVRIERTSLGVGMWQQRVGVTPGTVYELTGYVAFENIAPAGECRLQAVFKEHDGDVIEIVDLPGHDGSRGFEFDYPARLKFRAPPNSVQAEINCLLDGPGTAWFDDVFFGPAPVGNIAGRVTDCGTGIEGVHVYLHGRPWGGDYNDVTDANGSYLIEDVPVSFPRYILLAEKPGYKTKPVGDLNITQARVTTADIEIRQGSDPLDDLNVRFGFLELNYAEEPCDVPKDAIIPSDANGYPAGVRTYLESDSYITSDNPIIVSLANHILLDVPGPNRSNTYEVAWAVYEWIARNINHDAVFGGGTQPYYDVTSGSYQTIGLGGWGWGRNFYDWAYKPVELLQAGCGICVEHWWLTSALLRALNIPARARIGSAEFWVQKPGYYGYWVGIATNIGSNDYREHGSLGSGFGRMVSPTSYSVTSEPLLHEDWYMKDKCLWHEKHPWLVSYEDTNDGLNQALDDLNFFANTGYTGAVTSPPPEYDRYCIHYRDITVNLYNIGFQRTLDVRFPMVVESPYHHDMNEYAYWTNHPECVKRTWIQEVTNPPTAGVARWYHIEFDLTGLLQLGDLDGNGSTDGLDLSKFAQDWLAEGDCLTSDLDGDNLLNYVDFALLAKDWQH